MHDLSQLFFNHGFRFQDHVCDCCHDLTNLCLNVTNTDIITVKMYYV